MSDKRADTVEAAVADIFDGATIMVGGFGQAGSPIELIHALIDKGVSHLTAISNNAGSGHVGLAALIEAGQVDRMICSFPRTAGSDVFAERYRSGRIELELVPQGTLAERIRAGGAGIPAFYTPTGVGTDVAEGKEHRHFSGRTYLLETALRADFTLVRARTADSVGNLVFNKTARNFSPVMATAAAVTIVQADRVVAPGQIDPEVVVTPSIFVDRIVHVPDPAHEFDLVTQGARYP